MRHPHDTLTPARRQRPLRVRDHGDHFEAIANGESATGPTPAAAIAALRRRRRQ